MFKRLKSILIKKANDEGKRKYDITWKLKEYFTSCIRVESSPPRLCSYTMSL